MNYSDYNERKDHSTCEDDVFSKFFCPSRPIVEVSGIVLLFVKSHHQYSQYWLCFIPTVLLELACYLN